MEVFACFPQNLSKVKDFTYRETNLKLQTSWVVYLKRNVKLNVKRNAKLNVNVTKILTKVLNDDLFTCSIKFLIFETFK